MTAKEVIQDLAKRIAKDTSGLAGDDVEERRLFIIEMHLAKVERLIKNVEMIEAYHKPSNEHPPDGCAVCCTLRALAALKQ